MMQRHTGGVQGTVLWRGYCPFCKRGIAGGNMSRPPGEQISLRPHKTDPRHPGSPWCAGGRALVPADRDLMMAWGQRHRQAEERRRERWQVAQSPMWRNEPRALSPAEVERWRQAWRAAGNPVEIVSGPLPTGQLRAEAARRSCGDPDCTEPEHQL